MNSKYMAASGITRCGIPYTARWRCHIWDARVLLDLECTFQWEDKRSSGRALESEQEIGRSPMEQHAASAKDCFSHASSLHVRRARGRLNPPGSISCVAVAVS